MLLQTGDAFWLAVEAEHYNILQRELRERFPDIALVVMTLMDSGRVAYLPTAETYGKGVYQETIAMLAPGSLETLIEEVAEQMAAMGAGDCAVGTVSVEPMESFSGPRRPPARPDGFERRSFAQRSWRSVISRSTSRPRTASSTPSTTSATTSMPARRLASSASRAPARA